ncbi:MAG: hypothetical protein ABIQ31_15475 [Ferruginibacter sp.]
MSKRINIENFESLKELNTIELTAIQGGSGFWEDVSFVIGATLHFVAYAVRDGHNNPIRPSEYR